VRYGEGLPIGRSSRRIPEGRILVRSPGSNQIPHAEKGKRPCESARLVGDRCDDDDDDDDDEDERAGGRSGEEVIFQRIEIPFRRFSLRENRTRESHEMTVSAGITPSR